jgi:ATP synthase subunit 6
MNFFFSIIEQFEISEIIFYFHNNSYYAIQNIIVVLLFGLLNFWFISSKKYSVYYFFIKLFFFILKYFIKDKFSNKHFSIITSFFFYCLTLFIFTQNILGMIPETLTITSFILLPAHLSFMSFIASVFLALELTKYKWFKAFFPSKVPASVTPILVPIEIVSYFMRLVSLTVRLFINMLAGHALLKIFSIMVLSLTAVIIELLPFQILINFILFFLVILEYAACALQAVVLVSLVAIYIDHALNFIKH